MILSSKEQNARLETTMDHAAPLPADLLAILNAPCPPLPAEMVKRLNEALNANLEELAE